MDGLATQQRRELIDELMPHLARWADERLPSPMFVNGVPLTPDQRQAIVGHVASLVELAAVLQGDTDSHR